MRGIIGSVGLILLAIVAGLYLTRAETLSEDDIAGIEPDLARGEHVFHAAGCASCHAADDAEGDARLILGGGHRLNTPAGVFVAPNISQHPVQGIGDWTRLEFVNAIKKGTSPDGRHYYPAFPYAAYAKADLADIISLWAFLGTLPADPTPNQPHDLGFPYTIRLGIGAWKLLNVSDDFVIDPWNLPNVSTEYLLGEDGIETLRRGRYLVEALGHCGECHTPRTLTQGLDASRWLAGAPNPSGRGNIPNITPGKLDWSEEDIVAYLESGFTPEFDVAGGSMAEVVTSLSALPKEDLVAIATYLKVLPDVQ